MRYKRKLIITGTLLVLTAVIQYFMPLNDQLVDFYNDYIFQPFQWLRNLIFGHIPFSIGDLLYIAAALIIITVIIRWGYFIARFRSHKKFMGQSLLNVCWVLMVVYILFFIGWGGNYNKASLVSYWKLNAGASDHDSVLINYERFLIGKLNELAPQYRDERFRSINKRAHAYFTDYTDGRAKVNGLKVKPSFFGYFMQYLGIQGYYNPFTGEAQVNRFLPSFMLPFVTCHEMAHQYGIAAEDDANLLAYALCISSHDKDFSYSGYFNIFLYTHSRLRFADSAQASTLLLTLNDISHSQLDTLRAIRRRYRSEVSVYSSALYDRYLKLNNQTNGIDSYFGVVLSSWAWEEQRKVQPLGKLRIP